MLWAEIKCRSEMVNILSQVAFGSHGVNMAISADILRFGSGGRTDMERGYLQIGHGCIPVSISDNISILDVRYRFIIGARWSLSGLYVDNIAVWCVVLSNNRWAVAQDFDAIGGKNAPMINTDKQVSIGESKNILFNNRIVDDHMRIYTNGVGYAIHASRSTIADRIYTM